MRLILAVTALVLLTAGAAQADQYAEGYVDSNGYTWRSGYWWKADRAYKYERYFVDGYYYVQNCYRYWQPGYYAYKYVEYPVARAPAYPPTVPANLSPADPQWRTKLLEIAAARDKWEADIRRGAFEQQYFKEAVDALGLGGNFRWNGYGAVPPYPAGNLSFGGGYTAGGYTATVPLNGVLRYGAGFQVGGYGANASTIYGHSYRSVADLFGDTNAALLYQQANRQTENAQRLSGDAAAAFMALVQQDGKNRANVAEIIARGDAALKVIQSLDGPARSEQKTIEYGTGGVPPVAPVAPPNPAAQPIQPIPPATGAAPPASTRREFEVMFAQDCGSCHGAREPKGGFNLAAYYGMTPEQKRDKVWVLLVSPDKDESMPRLKNGGPAPQLPPHKLLLFAQN